MSFKVICICDIDFAPQANAPVNTDIKVGDILTVEREAIGCNIDKSIAIPCYKFYEHSGYVYDQRNFSPLPGIEEIESDETELIKEREIVSEKV